MLMTGILKASKIKIEEECTVVYRNIEVKNEEIILAFMFNK